MATPHINAVDGAFAETVLMPGDPLRAKYIADTFLEDVVQVTDVRNMFGYTGTYKGKKISVMGHGMGIPSCSIYAHELITEYGVKNIFRVGSCGAVSLDVKVLDVIIGMGASTDSKCNRIRFGGHDYSAIADYGLLEKTVNAARARKIDVKVGNIFSADTFYTSEPEIFDVLEKYDILGVEMEAAGIYAVAVENGAKAMCILTVSDHIRTGEKTTSDERQTSFNEMILIALDAAITA
ncbi:purine-nucleoside phosphorylase [Psychromonas sp. Urea-02u-13]|uniref:purine-nucleoside phosphorylase n=1 Tax=Psychromonas sp. Urea-02u-13 TaxID=2058326 RepID=UPI000C32B47B|nr:purine-nucleoside phosphorylase [Psychromonas sp. Urea-02u-13]PKG37805.1 purine-nucleoside phosphorylase [Psychromonas sp. Urea-02u-13]